MSEILSAPDLGKLSRDFPDSALRVRVQQLSKDKTRALLIVYVSHPDVQARLDEIDPAWSCHAIEQREIGETVYVRMRLTVKGISRENVGEGDQPKAAFSDALKRCAMNFGVGRYLYDWEKKWVDYSESRDRFREWTIEDYYGRKLAKQAQASPTSIARKDVFSPHANKKAEDRSVYRSEPGAEPKLLAVPRSYQVLFGKYRGKGLHEISSEELQEYSEFLIERAEKNGYTLSQVEREFLEEVERFLN